MKTSTKAEKYGCPKSRYPALPQDTPKTLGT